MITVTLPWPPSVNKYWRIFGNRKILSENGRAFKAAALKAVAQQLGLIQPWQSLACDLEVQLFAYPPDKRRRDVDNLFKAAIDSLTESGLIVDDSLISKLSIERFGPVKGGLMRVNIIERGTP